MSGRNAKLCRRIFARDRSPIGPPPSDSSYLRQGTAPPRLRTVKRRFLAMSAREKAEIRARMSK